MTCSTSTALYLLFLGFVGTCCSFVQHRPLPSIWRKQGWNLVSFEELTKQQYYPLKHQTNHVCLSPSKLCVSERRYSDDYDDFDDEEKSSSPDLAGVEAMRRILEASWDESVMGAVPSSPQKAAEAAATSVNEALNAGKNMLLIDILLPTYDITQGTNLYDEVLAVEFCVELAKCMQNKNKPSKAAILVRDGVRQRAVERLFNAREERRLEQETRKEEEAALRAEELDTDEDEDDEDEDYEDKDENNVFEDEFEGTNDSSMDDMDGIGNTSAGFVDDVELFRQQLSSNWDDDSAASEKSSPSKQNKSRPKKKEISKAQVPSRSSAKPSSSSSLFRIGSLFGREDISSGPDMFDQVIHAVDENAVSDDDDTLILLSAFGQDEMIAVRRIVAQYEGEKTILLVNCKLDPLPRELMLAETVYSILPLMAKPTVSESNIFASGKKEEEDENVPAAVAPKVVVLRRYPRDWEVYVDVTGGSSGFELVDSAPAREVGAKGPSMNWIAGCVKRHMDFKMGSR